MRIEENTLSFWRMMRHKLGSDHIASPITLQSLANYCRKHRPATVLELGAGIGTITRWLPRLAEIDAYEDNEFCLKALEELAKIRPITIIKDYHKLPPRRAYDLIIIDGGYGGRDGGYKRSLSVILNYLTTVKTIYIEGIRTTQRYEVIWALAQRYATTMKKIKGTRVDGTFYKGSTAFTCKKAGYFKRIALLFYNLVRIKTELFLKKYGIVKGD